MNKPESNSDHNAGKVIQLTLPKIGPWLHGLNSHRAITNVDQIQEDRTKLSEQTGSKQFGLYLP